MVTAAVGRETLCDTVRSDLPAVVMVTGGGVDITVTLPVELVGKASASRAKPEEKLFNSVLIKSHIFLEVTKNIQRLTYVQYR